MKKILFAGFFGMTPAHAKHYIQLFSRLGHTVHCEPYTFTDVALPRNHALVRNRYVPKSPHYDVMYCISGGSLHFSNLQPKISVDKIIFDSGPYYYSSKHFEHYLQNKYRISLPLEGLINRTYRACNFGSFPNANKEYWKTILDPLRPQLILTAKKDTIVDQAFIQSYAQGKENITHIEYNTGHHANIYKYNVEKYSADVQQFITS
jgi:hypothetical protein